MERPRAVEAVHVRSRCGGLVGADRSASRAPARRGLHEQFEDARPPRPGSGDEVVTEVGRVAAGLPGVVEFLRVSALLDGIRRVNRAPAILCGVWVLTLALSLPLGLAMRGLIAQHLGSSLAADTAASGVNYDWMQEFGDQATGLGATLKPTVIGAGAVLDNLSSFIDNVHRPIVIVGAAGAYLVLWLFVAGGIIDRYARERPTRAHGFFAASGVFFFRFLRLAVVMWIFYGFLFGYV